jgi:hypothetical protein
MVSDPFKTQIIGMGGADPVAAVEKYSIVRDLNRENPARRKGTIPVIEGRRRRNNRHNWFENRRLGGRVK